MENYIFMTPLERDREEENPLKCDFLKVLDIDVQYQAF